MEKLTRSLIQRLEAADPAECVDVIVEIEPTGDTASIPTRTERASAKQQSFLAAIQPLEEAIVRAGGEVTGKAWINDTLRVRLPAGEIGAFSALNGVLSVDLPHPMQRETA